MNQTCKTIERLKRLIRAAEYMEDEHGVTSAEMCGEEILISFADFRKVTAGSSVTCDTSGQYPSYFAKLCDDITIRAVDLNGVGPCKARRCRELETVTL